MPHWALAVWLVAVRAVLRYATVFCPGACLPVGWV